VPPKNEERNLIRRAASGEIELSEEQAARRDSEIIIWKLRRGEQLQADEISRVSGTLMHYLNEISATRNSKTTLKNELEQKLRHLVFGTRVLELCEGTPVSIFKIREAYEETGLPAISDTALWNHHWKPFVELAKSQGFVPYFSMDTETGTLAPTRFLPSDLKGQRGRPRRVQKKV
jgi:hypothetical protein